MNVSENVLIEVEQELSTGVGLPPRDVHVLVGRWSRITIRKALRELVRQGRVIAVGIEGRLKYRRAT